MSLVYEAVSVDHLVFQNEDQPFLKYNVSFHQTLLLKRSISLSIIFSGIFQVNMPDHNYELRFVHTECVTMRCPAVPHRMRRAARQLNASGVKEPLDLLHG